MFSFLRKCFFCCFKKSKCSDSRLMNLDNLQYEDTRIWKVPFKQAKIVKVYDGDTLTIANYIYGIPYRFRCRLARIDAPELKPDIYKSHKQKEYEIQAAILSKQALSNLCLGQIVSISNVKTEKWGRVLCELHLEHINISDYMLTHGLAVPYSGGKKQKINWKNFPIKTKQQIIIIENQI